MTTKTSWRDTLKIHPAADLFPLMPLDELKPLGGDIPYALADSLNLHRRHLTAEQKRVQNICL